MKTLGFILILHLPFFLFAQTNSKIAFTINEKDLIPEGIAFSATKQCFYLSSIFKKKIVIINADGSFTDFIASQFEGFLGGLGMKVDEKNQILWANSGDILNDSIATTGIFAFEIGSGKLRKKYLPRPNSSHFFNDLVLDNQGFVYISDMYSGAVYRFSLAMNEPEILVKSKELEYINGIAISDDSRFLYVDTWREGIKAIEIATQKIIPLHPQPREIQANGIDGLYFYQNSLIGVVNGTKELSDNQIVRFYLDTEQTKITQIKVLLKNHPSFQIPTTGVILGRYFYCIANSQLNLLSPDAKTISDTSRLKEVVILKIRL
jgi:hypothetical protein